MAKEQYINVGGTFRRVKKQYINVAGTFRNVKQKWIKVGATWKQVFQDAVPISSVTIVNKTYMRNLGPYPQSGTASASFAAPVIVGGEAPFTYLWELKSGDNDTHIVDPSYKTGDTLTLTTTTIAPPEGSGISYSEEWRVKVTDANGSIAYSNYAIMTLGCSTDYEAGCFASDTRIMMSDGSYKLAGDLMLGETLRGFTTDQMIDQSDPDWMSWSQPDLDDGSISTSHVTTLNIKIAPNYYTINGVVKVTGLHPFMVYRDGLWQWILVKDLVAGDYLRGYDGSSIEITGLSFHDEPLEIVEIGVEEVDTYFAGDLDGVSFVAHNK